MSLSVCYKNVRVVSPNGNLLSQGNMKCEDITTLENLNYEITYLDETQEEPVIEELPVETETIQIVEKPKPIYAIYESDIFDRSLTLVEEITQVKGNNIILKTENENLKQQLETAITQEKFNQYKLDERISTTHNSIASNFSKTKMGSSPEARAIEFTKWINETESAEIGLENFAESLGLTYNKRKFIPLNYSYSQGETLYYKNNIPNWTIEKWEQLP
tara:strand:+ start:300 stop:953 length:654 start_codon:yes stop_codon:yes gene_type:complete